MGVVREIHNLREKLHEIILMNQADSEQVLCSEPVLKCSEELDRLIELYYAQYGKA